MSDHPVDADSAAELAAQLEITGLAEAADDLPDELIWLGHVLSKVIPLDTTSDGRQPVRAWVRQGAAHWQIDVERHQADRVLGYHGMKLVRPKEGGPPTHLAIAYRADGLRRLHEDTHWAGRAGAIGGWKHAAEQLEGAIKNQAYRFYTGHGKGTAIPLKLIFPEGLDDEMSSAAHELPLGADR